jgi:hypothetical protein
MAEQELQAILADARRGTLPEMNATAATFADAGDEYLRYVAQVKQIDAVTVKDYRGVIDGYLRDEFGASRLELITPGCDRLLQGAADPWGRLSNRVIVRHLAVLHGIFKRAKRAYGLEVELLAANAADAPGMPRRVRSTFSCDIA